jgi:16S rRNA (cytidine1402-2'-O)-methyltransferase
MEAGTLYMVPTPIGNLSDISERSKEVLSQVDRVACEDTRVTGKLLKHFEISVPLTSLHQNNEHHKVSAIIQSLQSGESIAYCSDAGTPAISDPGFLLVREAIKAGIQVITLPGPSAVLPALVNSGIPCDRFVFEGFIPIKKGRQTRLESIAKEPRTSVLYESPHKLVRTLTDLTRFCGEERQASVSREISKLYEETVRGTLAELADHFTEKPPKGEFVIVLSGNNG